MKHFLMLILLFSLGNSPLAYAQAFEDKAPCPLNTPNPNVSAWDWTTQCFPMYLQMYQGQGVRNIPSPFYASASVCSDVGSLNNENINTRFNTANEPKDFLASEGWEYIQRDFGAPNRLIKNPHFILYNKYRGLLRVFVLLTELYAQNNGVSIFLRYPNSGAMPAVLDLYSDYKYRNALEDTVVVKPIKVSNYWANTLPYWLHADFQLNYDACICNGYSQLYLEVNAISSATLSFKINGNLIGQFDGAGRGEDRNTSIIKTALGGYKSVIASYKDAKTAVDMLKGFGVAVTTVGEKIIPGVGAALGLVDFLVGVFKKKEAPAPPKPITFNADLQATGVLENDNNIYAPTYMEMPGRNRPLLTSPIYFNNVPGVFNLMHKPVINELGLPEYGLVPCGGAGGDIFIPFFCFQLIKSTVINQLDKPIEYLINPAAGFKPNPEMEAQYAFEFESAPNKSLIGLYPPLYWLDDKTIASNFIPLGCFPDLQVKYEVYGEVVLPRMNKYVRIVSNFESNQANPEKVVWVGKFNTKGGTNMPS